MTRETAGRMRLHSYRPRGLAAVASVWLFLGLSLTATCGWSQSSGSTSTPQEAVSRLPPVDLLLSPRLTEAATPSVQKAEFIDGASAAAGPPPSAVLPAQAVRQIAPIQMDRLRNDDRSGPLPPLSPRNTEPISLHLDGVDIREALEMISRTHRVNILVAPNVSGQVTANFEAVPLDIAIDGMLKLCNLAAQREGELIFVYAAANLPKADMQLRVFPLDYASAQELLEAVKGLLSESGQAFVSTIAPDNNRRTKEAIVVTDCLANLPRVEEYILQMDQAPRQVMVEAHVLEVTLGDELRHGVNLKALLQRHVQIDLLGMAEAAASPALFARISGGDVDGLIECLEATTDAKTLASPRVMVVNGQKAQIQVGGQIGFKVITVTQTAAMEEVKFLDTGVILEVTPQITRDNRVLMRVRPRVASGEINPDTLLPESDTRELQTDVLLMDGQGVVIGGLIQEKDRAVRQKVPWLGDLWLIGKLFQRAEIVKERSEIVVTLVPRIVDCPVTCPNEQDMVDLERTQVPLFNGPLERVPRPWEPRMPNPWDNPRPAWPWEYPGP